jgi:hypothetical protein
VAAHEVRQVADIADEIIGPPLKVSWLVNSYDERKAVGPNIEHAGFGIDGGTGPIGTTDDTWNLDGAAPGGGRVQRAVVVSRDDLQRLPAQLWCQVDDVLLAHALDVDGCRSSGERLSFGRTLAREAGGGHRTILDWPYRFARDAVEHVDKGLLTDLGHGLDALGTFLRVG